MGHKIFVSYKYSDYSVQNLYGYSWSTVRDYVDRFEEKIDSSDGIYKGESNDEDLSYLSDESIWEKLKDRIYDSSVTIIFLSPNMKNNNLPEKSQWIPWEVSYSLNETSRKTKSGMNVTSHSNAMLAVVLPDIWGYYDWYFESRSCCDSQCVVHHIDKLFNIIRKNKFNKIKNTSVQKCVNNRITWNGTCSYIEAVRWSDFIQNYQYYVNRALDRQEHIYEYDIHKEVS